MHFGPWELVIIVLLVVILFGHNKIPGMMKNLADGLKVFKKEMKSSEEKPAPVKKPVAKKAVAKKGPTKKTGGKKK
ncbi:MAG: twin-arginine translocase TatA/TatE family subunit [Alphaproteobacteria bacterium]|nr:twin-arginine translocase TatA/TatE family subunit [Alphaproteobacteria bacterium]